MCGESSWDESRASCASTLRFASDIPPHTVYVSGVGGVGQSGDVGRHVGGGDPAVEGEGLALAQGDVELIRTKLRQPVETAKGHVALNRGELEGQRRQRLREACQHRIL